MMLFPGLQAYMLACGAAFLLVRRPLDRRGATIALAGFTFVLALPLLWMWLATEGASAFSHKRPVQLSVVVLHGLFIASLPSGLLRPFARLAWAAWLALVLAALLPFVCHEIVQHFGDTRSSYNSGIGSLGDLIFLDPIELGEGVTTGGEITYRYRVHHLALLGLVFASFLLHLPPVRRAKLSDRADPDRPR